MRDLGLVVLCLGLVVSTTGCVRSRQADRDRSSRPEVEEAASALPEATAVPTGTIGAAGSPTAPTDDLAATVNGTPIPLGVFQQRAFEVQRYYVESGGVDPNSEEGQRQLLDVRRQVMSELINQALIEQAAAELGITATEAELAERMQGYIDDLGGAEPLATSLAEDGTTREEVMSMERSAIISERMIARITADVETRGEAVHARHILCNDEASCRTVLERLNAGEDFAALAAEVSEDTSTSDRGGDLDWIVRGTVPSQKLEDAIFALAVGQRSEVVATEFGYHVIELLDRAADRQLTVGQQNALQEKRLLDWLAERRAASVIQVHIPDLAELASP